jgi:hypothetical protein
MMTIDSGAKASEVPYILPEFSYFFETPFGVTDPDFPDCSIDRPRGASATGHMYIVNHFLDVEIPGGVKVPDRVRAFNTNSQADVGKQVGRCEGLYGGVAPNFVLLDFVDVGNWPESAKGNSGFLGKAGGAACGLFGKIGIDC